MALASLAEGEQLNPGTRLMWSLSCPVAPILLFLWRIKIQQHADRLHLLLSMAAGITAWPARPGDSHALPTAGTFLHSAQHSSEISVTSVAVAWVHVALVSYWCFLTACHQVVCLPYACPLPNVEFSWSSYLYNNPVWLREPFKN